ncbi:MAG: DUF732 domain-containing protein [Mycobacterium sp.]
MISHRRRAAAAVAAAAGVLLTGAVGIGPATATTEDERFIAVVEQLDIAFAPGTDLPAVGRGVCENITQGARSGFNNPVTAVLGVVTALENTGMTRGQAVGLLQISVLMYCPEFRSFLPR